MKDFDKKRFFAEIGLANLPENKKDEIWTKFIELVSLEVLDKALGSLSQKEAELLFFNLAKNPKEVEKFLRTKKLQPVIVTAWGKIKKEMIKNLPKKF